MKTTLAFIRELKNEVQGTQRSSWVIPKEVAVAYESFSLQSLSMDNSDGLSHSSNGVSPGGFTNVVYWSLTSYKSGRKESFDCPRARY